MRAGFISVAITAAAVLSSCASSSATSSTSQATATPSAQSASPEPSGVALTGGDIPDNQVFLDYPAAGAPGVGFTIKYPEGWVLSARSGGVTFTDKDNKIAVAIRPDPPPTVDSLRQDLATIRGATVTTAPRTATLNGGAAVAATYQVDGQPSPVTGKRARLTIDVYELGNSGNVAIVELATPVGVDNVDAYKMIAGSFHWR